MPGAETVFLTWRRPAGISQVELVIVATIVAVAMGVASLSFHRAVSSSHLQRLADKLIADLDYARIRSSKEQRNYQVMLKPSQKLYEVRDESETILWTVNIDSSDYRTDSLETNLKNASKVVYDRYGLTDNHGTIELRTGQEYITIEICRSGMVRQLQ